MTIQHENEGQSYAMAPEQGNRTRETFIINSMCGKKREVAGEEQERAERKTGLRRSQTACRTPCCTWLTPTLLSASREESSLRNAS